MKTVYHTKDVVSVLFNEPKLLKSVYVVRSRVMTRGFSALQRAEIAEIITVVALRVMLGGFSALQRAEIAEMWMSCAARWGFPMFQCSSTSRNC